jgi:hypothetical protein
MSGASLISSIITLCIIALRFDLLRGPKGDTGHAGPPGPQGPRGRDGIDSYATGPVNSFHASAQPPYPEKRFASESNVDLRNESGEIVAVPKPLVNNGINVAMGMLDKRFINNKEQGTVDFIEPYVLLLDGGLNNSIMGHILRELNGKPVVVVCTHIQEDYVEELVSLTARRIIKMCVIVTSRWQVCNLVYEVSGLTMVSNEDDNVVMIPIRQLGRLSSISVGMTTSTLYRYNPS